MNGPDEKNVKQSPPVTNEKTVEEPARIQLEDETQFETTTNVTVFRCNKPKTIEIIKVTTNTTVVEAELRKETVNITSFTQSQTVKQTTNFTSKTMEETSSRSNEPEDSINSKQTLPVEPKQIKESPCISLNQTDVTKELPNITLPAESKSVTSQKTQEKSQPHSGQIDVAKLSPFDDSLVGPLAELMRKSQTVNIEPVKSIGIPTESEAPITVHSPAKSTSAQNQKTSAHETMMRYGEIFESNQRNERDSCEGPEVYKNILQATVVYGIFCEHGKMPLMRMEKQNALWLPYAVVENDRKVKISEQWKKLRHHFGEITNSSMKYLENIQLSDELTLQLPNGCYVTRYSFIAKWAPNSLKCCTNTPTIEWISLDALISPQIDEHLQEQLWGKEVGVLAKRCIQLRAQPTTVIEPYCSEFIGSDMTKFLTRNENAARKMPKELEDFYLSANFKERDIVKIYGDFVQHCYPAETMSQRAFLNYCEKINFTFWNEAHLKSLFRSMFLISKESLRFEEFLLGIAVLKTKDSWNTIRFQYIFRFYDQNSDKLLEPNDFLNLLRDIEEARGSKLKLEQLLTVFDEVLPLFTLNSNNQCTEEEFLRHAHRIPGVMCLLRTNQDILSLIHTSNAYQLIVSSNEAPFKPTPLGTCQRCIPKNYSIGAHTATLGNTGNLQNQSIAIDAGDSVTKIHFEDRKTEPIVRHSLEMIHSENSVANRVLAIIRQMAGFVNMQIGIQMFIAKRVTNELSPTLIGQLCREVIEVFATEPRVLKTTTPCYVMGDIHGNISDLLGYEKQLWSLAPLAQGPNILFLGDYVDRGDFSIEVVCYLFAMKLLAPFKFNILRGNHEIRSIQRNFTFYRECLNKYQRDGQYVFDCINSVLDYLPIVGIIDESIYCAHGGIPHCTTRLEDLYNIPTPLPDPEQGSRAAWEILWNDPVTEEELRDVCAFNNTSPASGWTENIRRSTAFYFSETATRAFLKANNLSHVIRAHEMEMCGYRLNHSGSVITVFSSSRYCQARNRAASIFCDTRQSGGILKILSLDS